MPTRFLPVRVALFVVIALLLVWSSPVHADTPPAKFDAVPQMQSRAFTLPTAPTFPTITDMAPLASGAAPVVLNEVEPNNTSATANPLTANQAWARGTIGAVGDVDFYRFTAQAGDRIYASTQTLWAAAGSADTVVEILSTNGTTVLESDNDDGSFGNLSSIVAGLTLSTAGQYYIRVTENGNDATLNRYDLFVRLQRGTPTAEVEPNNTELTATPLGASRWASGTINPATDIDVFSFPLNAGDSVYVALDLAPSPRTGSGWDGDVYLGLFANQGSQYYYGSADESVTRPNSEAYFMRVQTAGTYYAAVNRFAGGTNANRTYNLSVTVFPAVTQTCNTFTSTNVPQPIGPNVASPPAISTLGVSGQPAITDINVTLNLTHTYMQDVNATLIAPNNTVVPLFSGVGMDNAATVDTINSTLDDQAPVPIYAGLDFINLILQPAAPGALSTFNGLNPNGTWTLQLDDAFDGDGGNLIGWSIELCSSPLAVTLNAFDAQCSADGVNLAWETASETNLLGFNVYRAVVGGDAVQLNGALIPAQSPGGGQGATYAYTDSTVTDGNTYDYYLDAVNTDGTTQRFGPTTSAFPCAPTAIQSGEWSAAVGAMHNEMAWVVAGLLVGTVVLTGAWRARKHLRDGSLL